MNDKIGLLGTDELTEAEKAYFSSGGKDVSGLLQEDLYKEEIAPHREEFETQTQPAAAAPPPASETPPTPTAPAAPPPPAAQAKPPVAEEVGENEEFRFEELQVGPDGRLRDERGRYVPLKALQNERERYRSQRDENATLKAQNTDLQSRFDKLATRMDQLNELWTKQTQPAAAAPAEQPKPEVKKETPPPPPDPEQDIFAYARWQTEQLARYGDTIKALEEKITSSQKAVDETKTEFKRDLGERDMVGYYRADAAAFAAEKPDFGEAYRHLIRQRHGTLEMLGFADEKERAAQINAEERELVQRAIAQGRRPAEFIYAYAMQSGYRTPAPAPTPTPAPAPAAAAPAPAPAPTPAAAPAGGVPAPSDRLASQIAAQNASQTLSGAGGTAPETLSLQALADMSEEQFAAVYAKLGKAGMRQYLGGGM